jgi:hypothetical protein
MNKKQTIMLAVAGAALLAASQAQAQLSPAYSQGNLLLDFRNTTTTTPADVTVDLGSISTFMDLTGTTVLDAVSGVTPTPGYTTLFTATELTSIYSTTLTGIGFTAVADTADNLFLTRTQSSTSEPSTKSASMTGTAYNTFSTAVNNIGLGASGGNVTTANSLDSGNRIVSVSTGQTDSYQSQGTYNSGNTINYNNSVNTVSGAGGSMENVGNGTSATYSALWEQTPGGASSSDVYLGYFTFDTSGEVDFTSINPTPTPEPSTIYGLVEGLGFLALIFRRQFRSLTA